MASMVRRIEKFANLVLLLGAVICVLVFGLLVWRHGLSLHYLVIPGFATMLVWGWQLPQSVKVNSVLCMLSMLVAVYSAELILTYSGPGISSMGAQAWLSFPQDANAQVAAERMKTVQITNQKFDTRTRLEVVRDMRAQGVHAYPDVFPMVLFAPSSRETIQSVLNINHEEFLPVAGMATTTTVFCNESGEYVVYESDEHGFHNPRGMWGKRPVEILALGDSYTHGVCVPSDKGFVAVVRSQHAATINLGVNGHGPLTSLATLKEYGPILEPKLVLWFYYEGNDLRDLDGWEKNSPLLMKYLTSSFSQHLFERQGEIDRSLRNYLDVAMTKATASVSFENILKLQRLRHTIQSFYERRSTRHGLPADLLDFVRHTGAPAAPEDLQLFERILAEAQTTAQTWKGRVVFVYLPTWERYRFPELASQDRDNVLMIVRQLSLPIVDIHKIFSEHSDPLSLFPYRRYAHYNEAGHQLVGEEVLRQLRQL